MRNKKIIIFIIVVLLAAAIGVIFIFSTNKSTKQNNNFFDNVQSSLSCAKEGERVRASGAGFPEKCCSNLKAMYGYAQEDCNAPGLTGDNGTCSNCGNGICETQNNENKCNCSEDCKGEEAPCIDYFQNITDESKQVCCGKFKPLKIALYQNDCSIVPNSSPVEIKCMNCGDGHCDQGVYLENKCNCPEDCK